MPASSKSQYRYIRMLKERYGSEADTPDEHKWVWERAWTDVDYKKLPDAVEKEAGLDPQMGNMAKASGFSAAQLEHMRATVGQIMPLTQRGFSPRRMDAEMRALDIMGGTSVANVPRAIWNRSSELREQFKHPPTLQKLWDWLGTAKADAPVAPPQPQGPLVQSYLNLQ